MLEFHVQNTAQAPLLSHQICSAWQQLIRDYWPGWQLEWGTEGKKNKIKERKKNEKREKIIKTRQWKKKKEKKKREESWAVFKILSPFRILSVNSFLEMLTQPVLDKNCQEGTDVISHRACQAHVQLQVNLQYCAVATFGYIPDAGWSLFSMQLLPPNKTLSSSTNLICCSPFLYFLLAVALSSPATTHPTSDWQEFSLFLNDWQPVPQGGK